MAGKKWLKFFNLSSHIPRECEISLLQKGLSFAPSCNANLFDLFKDLHKYICDIKVKSYSLKSGVNSNDTPSLDTKIVPTLMEPNDADRHVMYDIDKETLNILEELLLEGGPEGDFSISTPFNNNILHTTFRPKSTFYPHHIKNEYIKTFFFSNVFIEI